MPEVIYQEVRFDQYCAFCKYYSKAENESPCNECLEEPTNLYSKKPIKWEASDD